MTEILQIREQPTPDLVGALEQFELQFSYPLGASSRFRIDHGEDYTRFFRAMGDTTVFCAYADQRVLATLAVVERGLLTPSGSTISTFYFGDLKVLPQIQRGFILRQLFEVVMDWAKRREDTQTAYAVVMGGTERTPERYSGRLGFPTFDLLTSIEILSLPIDKTGDVFPSSESASAPIDIETVTQRFIELAGPSFLPLGGSPRLRSQIAPQLIVHDRACGLLQDTRSSKRLLRDDGSEIRAAHLSHFGFENAVAGRKVIDEALARANSLGFDSMFVSVPKDRASPSFVRGDATVASADIYGFGLPAGQPWSVHTAEI